MKLKIGQLLVAMAMLLPATGLSQTDYANAIEQSKQILSDALEDYPGIAASVVIGDQVVWEEGFGYANVATGEKVSSNHRFMFYSLSKSILGRALYQLELEGKLNIEKAITDYLPDLPEAYRAVSIKQLLSHMGGVRHYNKGEWMKISMDQCTSPKEAIEVFINDPLESDPGSSYSYSSFGYVLLSHLLEVVSDTSFDEYIQQELFAPRGITSIFRPVEPTLSEQQAVRYASWKFKKSKAEEATVNNSCKFGGGGFIGTATDLARFQAMVLLEEQSKEGSTFYINLKEGDAPGYGYGIGVNTSSTGFEYYSHTGSGSGGSAVLMMYPDQQLVVVLVGNIKADALKNNVGKIGKAFKDVLIN